MKLLRQTAVSGRCTRVGQHVLGAFIALCVAGSSVVAQQVVEDPHRWAAAVTIDVGTLPDAFATQCGSGAVVAYGGGLAALLRPHRWLIVTADTRVSAFPDVFGCNLALPAPVLIGPNEYESWADKQYPSGVMAKPLVSSALHVGLETPPGFPLLRATIGGGTIWSGRRMPYGALSVGGGSRGRGARFYWELETNVSSVRVHEEHSRFQVDSNMAPTLLPPRFASYIEHPGWTMLHLGMEMPLVFR